MTDTPPASAPPHPSNAPALFSDGVANLAIGPGVVKFYLLRLDPSPANKTVAPLEVVCAQVIMPIEAFVATALFFKDRLDNLVASGIVDAAEVAKRAAEIQADR